MADQTTTVSSAAPVNPTDPTALAATATNIETIIASIASAVQMITEPTAITAIEGFLTALPNLLLLLKTTENFWSNLTGDNAGSVIAEIGNIMNNLTAAQTDAQKQAVAISIQNIYNQIKAKV